MKIVYIAHAIRGDIEANLVQVHRYMRWALDQGYIPVAPYIPLLRICSEGDEEERRKGIEINIRTLKHVDELWLCGPRISEGMMLEIRGAQMENIKIVQPGKLPEKYQNMELIYYVD